MSNRIAAFLVCSLTFGLCGSALGQELPSDPSFVKGTLDNGLTYIVRQHSNPPGRAVVWMHIHSGSLNETDQQRGLAHYLEHMAFNGSPNFPPGSVVPFFQSLGMTFGRDQNAFTNLEQTTYQLSLPDAKPETLGKGMTFFSDVMTKLLLTPAEIDAERGIIQEERRRGLSARQRTSDYIMERIAPGSLYGQRDTIGTEASINGVQKPDFTAYYGKWYAACNTTLMVVADADPAEVIKVIKAKFGDAPKKAKPTPQASGVKKYEKSFAIVASDPEINSENIRIVKMEPARPAITTVPLYRANLVSGLGESAMNRRLDDKISGGGMSLLSARVAAGNDANTLYSAEISGRAVPGKWKQALEEMAQELQSARAFGFTAHELDDVRKQMLSGAQRAVETEGTIAAGGIIGRLNGSLASGDTVMSPRQRLELLNELLPTITAEEVAKRFADEFDPKAVAFVAVLPTGPGTPSESQLLEIGLKALEAKPTQMTETAHATELMTELPTPGKVTESDEHAATKVWSGWLSNNVRLHYKFVDYRENEVSVGITLVGGDLLETKDNRGITSAAQLAWSRPATKSLPSSDIREIMTGKKVNVRGGGGFGGGGRGGRGGGGGGAGGSTLSLSISGSPEELETGFQLAYLLLTEPKIEAAQFVQFQTTMKQALEESMKNPMAFGARLASALPYPDDEVRTTPVTAEQIEKLTLEGSQAWLEKLIKESPIEVSIVGDLPKEKAIELATRYLGSLPAREKVSPSTYASLRQLKRPKGARVMEKTLDTPTKQAFVLSGFYGCDESNVADARALTMASRVLSTRMVKEVREDAQLVYSIGAGSRPASTFPGFGVFSSSAPTEPSKAAPLAAKLTEMYEVFAKSGPSEEELDVARKQMANTLEESVKDPSYWSGKIGQMTYRGTKLDDVASEAEAYQAITTTQVHQAFAKYWSKDNAIVLVVKPAASDETATGSTPAMPAEK